jgi:hypothetical protein
MKTTGRDYGQHNAAPIVKGSVEPRLSRRLSGVKRPASSALGGLGTGDSTRDWDWDMRGTGVGTAQGTGMGTAQHGGLGWGQHRGLGLTALGTGMGTGTQSQHWGLGVGT